MTKWLTLCLLGLGAAHAADMTELRYVEQDPGDPPYLTRILVTPDFLRMDDGNDDGDFVLLDRRGQKVINVMHGNRLAMVFTPGTLPPRPAGWKPILDVRPAARDSRRFSLSVKGVVCSEGIAARRAAPDAARAMAELKGVLAAMQYRVWKDSPSAIQHDCDLANLVWEPGATLKLGLPLEEREFTGRTRQFESESKQPLRPELFRVPDGMTSIDAPS
ncbi:MAG: hypothetical protein M1449_06450 [Candidatus Thermoplasmatota archaeon]|nr:hypothetical protein [Candidatus Thermoplasmatota archaeon]